MCIRIINTILLVFFVATIQGQPYIKKNFTLIRTKDGLSNNNIFSIKQDAYGYIWVATERGLNRFDGSGFQQFYSDSSSRSLPLDIVHDLKWMNGEELAVLTMAGLHIVNAKTLETYNLIVPADSLKVASVVNRIYDVSFDKNGNLFILTTTGFYHFSNRQLVFRYDHYSKADIGTKRQPFGLSAAFVNNNAVLVTANEGLYLYDIEKKDLHPFTAHDDPFLRQIAEPKQKLRFIYSDEQYLCVASMGKKELIFFDLKKRIKLNVFLPDTIRKKISAESVIYRLNDSLMAITFPSTGFCMMRFNRQSDQWQADSTISFERDLCTAIVLDRNNRLWVGTINGVYKQNRFSSGIEQVILPGEDGRIQKTISAFAAGNDKLFVGTWLEGLYVFARDSLVFLKHMLEAAKGATYITQLVKLNEDSIISAKSTVIINTRDLSFTALPLDSLIGKPRFREILFKDSRGRIYITKNLKDSVYYKDPGDKHFSVIKLTGLLKIVNPKQMAEDNDRNLWFGGEGLIRLNSQTKAFDIFLDSFPAIKTRSKTITSNIIIDSNGILYFGLAENGLLIYDVNRKTFSQVTRSNGLPDNTILALYLHKNKTLWIATESGLASYDLSDKRTFAFGASDGMPVDAGTCHTLYYDSVYRQLYAGFTYTVVRFNPDEMIKNHAPPIFFIESIDISGKEMLHKPGTAITVPYKHNNLIINLAAINFEDAPHQLFAYRLLKDGNEAWQEIGTQHKVFLTNLPPGKHKLQLKVYIRNRSWPDQVTEIVLTVRPPFWKTIWFFLIIGVVLGAFLFYLHKRRINKLTQKANVDKQLARTEMKALHAQMNPHFIFNCLNSIREMILHNENQQASHYLSKFAQIIRITLNQSSKAFISLANTIDYLQRYAEMEKIRNSKFSYTIEVDDQLQPDEIMIPPMLIQPFLENAIWHGAVQGKELQIRIRFKKDGNRLVCFVEDNGQGIDASLNNKKEMQPGHNSIGITNVMERIQVLNEKYKLNSELSIEDKSRTGHETGTIVKLYFPLQSIAL